MVRLFVIFFILGVSGAPAFAEVSEEVRKYHRLLLKKPGNETLFERFLQVWLTTGNREGLEDWLEGETENGTVADWQILATYHVDMGESGEALAALDRAVKIDGENLPLKLARAKLRAKGMDFDGALEDLKPLVEDEELQQEALTLQGVYQVRIGRPNDAVRTWEELVKRFPGDEGLREDLIEIEIEEGLFERAIESSLALVGQTKDPYQKALRQIRLAEVYGLSELRDESLATYEKVMAASGEGTWLEREVLSQVEQIYALQDDVQGVRDYYQKLREKYPRRTSVRKALARQMARNDELEEAIALFREILKITPGDVGNREEFVAFLEVNERWEEAGVELEGLIKLKGDDPLLWERVVFLKHRLEDEAGLREGLVKLRELKGGDAEGVVAVALLYGQLELAKDAEGILREGRKEFSDSTAIAEALAEVLVKTERRDEARELWLASAASGERDEVLRAVRSLAKHEMKVEAFELLLEHVEKSPEDLLLVAPLGQLALTPEQAAEATPFLLEMVGRATTPTSLESSATLAAGVVLRSGLERQVLVKLNKEVENSATVRCLLAELHAATGDRMKAREILEKGGENLLVKFFRVRFEEKEGDLGTAISLLEGILDEPGERKTVHLRRLVDLYQKSGRLNEALERADEWKKMSPGNKQSWLTKARLLTAAGQQEKAVAEYRRIMGKFGADEESRARLASALEVQGDFQGAGKVYRKLYETAEEQGDQLRWVAKWMSVMQQIDRGDEVVGVLEERKKTNRKSAGPLLALAEVYQVMGEMEMRREALYEAVRRKPGGWEILLDLAKEAEKDGDFESAVKTLKEAMVLEKGEKSKRALAELLLKRGDLEEGLALIRSIPGEGDDPRQVEKTVEVFARSNHWEIAERYLAEVLPKHVGDWRLEYLQGLLYLRRNDVEKTLEIMTSLSREVQPLTGVVPSVSPPAGIQLYHPYLPFQQHLVIRSAEEVALQKIYQRCLMPVGQEQRNPFTRNYGGRSGRPSPGVSLTPLFDLPATPEDLRSLALVRKAILLNGREDEASRNDFDELIQGASFDEKLILLRRLRADLYRDFLLAQVNERPDDPKVAWLWLQSTSREDEENREVTKEAFDLLLREAPIDLLKGFSYYFGKFDTYGERGFQIWKELYLGLSDDEKKMVLPTLLQSFGYQQDPFAVFGVVPNSTFEKEWSFLEAEVLKLEQPIQYPSFYQATVVRLLKSGKGEEAVRLINRCVEWTASGVVVAGQNPQNQRRSQGGFGAVAMPGYSVGAFLDLAQIMYPQGQQNQLGKAEKERQLALLEKLGEVGGEKLATLFPAEVLAPHVELIKNLYYRGLILMLLNDKAEFEKLIPMMAKSKDARWFRLVAAYRTNRKEFRKAYDYLVHLSKLQLDRNEHRILDGNLAYTANQLSKVELDEVDLGPARNAMMRVQRQAQKGNWQQVMRKLGMIEEADRLDRIEKSKRQGGQRSRRPIRRIPVIQGKELIEKELAADAPKKAIAEMKRLVRGYRGGSKRYPDWRKLLTLFEEASQIAPLLKELKPKGRGRIQDWFQYGGVASQTEMSQEAREAFEKVLARQPDHHEARVELFLLESEEDRDWSIFSMKKNPDSALALGYALNARFSSQRPGSYELMMITARAARAFLEGESEVDSRMGTNDWVSRFLGRADAHYQFGDFEISPMNGSWKIDETKWDREKSDRRVMEFQRINEAMINHGLLAENGFQRMRVARKTLKLTDEDLFQYANQAFARALTNPDQVNQMIYLDPYTRQRSYRMSSPSMRYLLDSGKERKGQIFTAATLKMLAVHRPTTLRNYQFILKIMAVPSDESGELYTEWLAGSPENEEDKRAALIQMTRFFTAFEVADGKWAELHRGELIDLPFNQHLDSSFLTDWGKWVLKRRGSEGFNQWVFEVCENLLGDRERWPLLADLSHRFRPVADQSKISICQQQMRGLSADPLLAAPTAAALKSKNLDRLLPVVGKAFRDGWRGQNPSASEEYFDWLKTFGGLATSRDSGQPDVFRMLMFVDALGMAKIPREKEVAGIGKKLDEDKELDPLMKELLKAHWKLPVELPNLLDGNLEVFEKMAEVDPLETALWLGRSLSSLEGASLSEKSRSFMTKVTGRTRERAFDHVMELAKQAGGAKVYLGRSENITFLAGFIPFAPLEMARAFESLLEQALEELEDPRVGTPLDSMSTDQFVQGKLSSISQVLIRPENRSPIVSKWRFLNALFHGGFKNRANAIFRSQGQFIRLLSDRMEKETARIKKEDQEITKPRASVVALQPILARLSVEERRSLLLFLTISGNSEFGSYRDPTFQEDFEWMDQEFRKDFPVCADWLTMVMARGIDGNDREKFDKEVGRGSANLLRFLRESHFSGSLGFVAARMLLMDSSLKLHLASSDHWQWMGEAIKGAGLAETASKTTAMYNFLTYLNPEDFESVDEISPVLISTVMEILKNGWKESSYQSAHEKIFGSVMKLAVRRGDRESVKGMMAISPKVLNANLGLQWSLFEAGYGDLLPGVFDHKSKVANRVEIPRVGKGSQERIQKFAALFPKNHRFHIERLFLTARDLEGEFAPEVSYQERIPLLARRYLKEGGGPREFVLSDLGFFANFEKTFPILEDHFVAEGEKHLLGFRAPNPGEEVEDGQLRRIVWAAVMIEAGRENFGPALRQFRSIFGQGGGDRVNLQDADRMVTALALEVLRLAIKSPERAAGFVDLADELFKGVLRLPNSSTNHLTLKADAFSSLLGILAEKPAPDNEGLRSWKEYQEFRKRNPLTAWSYLVKGSKKPSGETLAMLVHLQQRIFASKFYLREVNAHPGPGGQYFHSHAFDTGVTFDRLLGELPGEVLKEPFFRWRAGFLAGGPDEIVEALSQARNAAKEAGLEEMEAEIMIDIVTKLRQLNRDAGARALAKEIDPELVQQNHRWKRIETFLKAK